MLGWCDEMYVRVCYDVIWFVMKQAYMYDSGLWCDECFDTRIRWMLGCLIYCMIRCMAGFVCKHDRCMVKDVWCHVVC